MLRFKVLNDKELWNDGIGPQEVRDWIALFNAISWHVAGREAVVTSWFRGDGTFHESGDAVDFRRLSAANAVDPKPYTPADVKEIEFAAIFHRLPLVIVHRGEAAEHWHCGPVHLLE